MADSSGWDFGPGNMDDNSPSAGDYTVPTQDNYNSYYGINSGQDQNNSGYDNVPQSDLNYNSDMFQGQNNFGQGLQQTQGLNSLGQFGNAGNLMSPIEQAPNSGVMNTLSQLFNSKQGQGITAGIGALMSGFANKQKANQLGQLAQQLRSTSDPFGSQRPFYQQQLQQATQNPYSSPIVANQVNALQQAQAIKDAAAGRRSNSMTSAPALLAAQAQVAQNYMNSLQNPAGAGIAPNTGNYMQAQTGAINAGANGFLSPLASAIGFNQQGGINSDIIQNLAQSNPQALQKLFGG